ncbi:uncharacterized protein LOC144445388 [Glandiceps talaboti]
MVNFQKWLKTVVAGGNLWSTAAQSKDDDDDLFLEEQISHCHNCQNYEKIKTQAPELKTIPVKSPWYMVGMDLIGPLPPTDNGNVYIMTVTDYFTKSLEAFALPFGAANHILSDQGREFINKIFRMFSNTPLSSGSFNFRFNLARKLKALGVKVQVFGRILEIKKNSLVVLQNDTTGKVLGTSVAYSHIKPYKLANQDSPKKVTNAKDQSDGNEGKTINGITENKSQSKEVHRRDTKAPDGPIDLTKTDNDQDLQPKKPYWVSKYKLHASDRDTILAPGTMLSDVHINTVQKLISEKFPTVPGLQDTLLGAHLQFNEAAVNSVQIMHNGGFHWVTSSSIAGKVTLFDSMYTKPSAKLECQLANLYAQFKTEDTINITMPNTQRQSPYSNNCGLFVIANTFELCAGRIDNIDSIKYDEKQMRMHLVQCCEDGSVSAFPKLQSKTNRSKGSKLISLILSCHLCTMPESFSNMIQCSKCIDWFHFKCLDEDFEKIPKVWRCERVHRICLHILMGKIFEGFVFVGFLAQLN